MESSLGGQWDLLSHVLPCDNSPIQKLLPDTGRDRSRCPQVVRSMSRKEAQPWKSRIRVRKALAVTALLSLQ